MAAGARRAPNNKEIIYFCASRLYGVQYKSTERVGLYSLNTRTKAITPIVLDVPFSSPTGGAAIVYLAANAPRSNVANAQNSTVRPLAFCNDLDVSEDGQRLYFTEPFAYGSPSMGGGGTYQEAISLGQNGRIWSHDLGTGDTRLVAQNFIFPDGILVENTALGTEQSLLVTETVNFRLLRLYIGGAKAGTYETLWDNLPGMPDGMDRDKMGRIWIGMLKQRSPTTDLIHKYPWVKHLLLRLPADMMPIAQQTSILGLSADAATPLFYSVHNGSKISDISVVIPGETELYLATVGAGSSGLYSLPFPENLQPE